MVALDTHGMGGWGNHDVFGVSLLIINVFNSQSAVHLGPIANLSQIF